MKRRYFIILLTVVLCLGILAGCGVNVEKTLEKAEQLESNGEYAKAAVQYEKILSAEPDNIDAKRRLYTARVEADFSDAAAWIDFLTEMEAANNPVLPRDLLLRAQGNVPQDEEVQQLISKFMPPTPRLYYNLGTGYPGIGSFSGNTPRTSLLETAFEIHYDSDFRGFYTQKVWYSINGKEKTIDYIKPRRTMQNPYFSDMESIFFSTPGTYTVEVKSYIPELDMWTKPERAAEFTIPADCVGTVILSKPGGSYDTLGGLDLTTEHGESTIYYTLDGSDPVVWDERGFPTMQGKKFSGVIALNQGTNTLSARCVNAGGIVGELTQATYDVKSISPSVVQRSRIMDTDGRFIYLATKHGLIRQNYDGSDEGLLFEGQVNSVAALSSGKVAFNATPEKKFNQENPYYVYYYDNGKIERSNGRTDFVSVRAVGDALYTSNVGFVPFGDTTEPALTDAQKKASFFNEKYNVYSSNFTTIEVSATDGTNRRTIIDPSTAGEKVSVVTAYALMGDKLIYSTYWSDLNAKGVSHDRCTAITRYYVVDLSTGQTRTLPELNTEIVGFNNQTREPEVQGFTSNAVYYSKGTYINGQKDYEWIRKEFNW